MKRQTCSLLDEELTYKKGGNNMKTKIKKLIKNQKGMTLIELLAVIVIIAIIALIAIPAIANIINKSHDKAILSDASQVISAAKIAISDGACGAPDSGTTTCDKTELSSYVEGVELDKDDKVVKTSDGYTVYYLKLKDSIRTDDIKNAIGYDSTKGLADTKLAEAMGNK